MMTEIEFKIDGARFYHEEDGSKDEVLANHNGKWYRIISEDEPTTYIGWEDELSVPALPPGGLPVGYRIMPPGYAMQVGDLVYGGYNKRWMFEDSFVGVSASDWTRLYPEDAPHYVASPVATPEPEFVINVGEGYRLLDSEKDTYQPGDELSFAGPGYGWIETRFDLHGLTPAQINVKHPYSDTPWIFRRKVFRVSDNGPGIYETRAGVQVPVKANLDPSTIYPQCDWRADFNLPTGNKHAWWDTGHYEEWGETPYDLVKYIGPLPPEWKKTGEMRRVVEYGLPDKNGWRVVSMVGPTMEKWIRGDEVEWRDA